MTTLQNTFTSDTYSPLDRRLSTNANVGFNFSKASRKNSHSLPEVKVDSFGNVVIGGDIIIPPSRLEEFTQVMNNLKEYMSYDD